MYFSIRKPTEDERQGARPPAVRIATFAYGMHSLGSFRAARFAREGARSIVLARFAREGAWSIVCVVGVRRGRGGGVGGPRWPRSGGASAGLPPRTQRLQAPPVPRAHGCQQRWNVQRGRASGSIDARRLRKPRISATCETQGPLSPTAAREQLRLAEPLSRGPIVTHLLRRLVILSHGCD